MREIEKNIEDLKGEMVEALKKFISINSVNPSFGGPGEYKKAIWLENLLKMLGYDEVRRIDIPDDRVEEKVRPNVIGIIRGKESGRKIWIVTHMDTVPEGDRNLWETDPFEGIEKDGRIFGRGAEDNGGSMIASIYAGVALKRAGIKPDYDYCVALVADEEAGSEYGIAPLLRKGIFGKEDLVIVADAGEKDGSFIEVAEKSIVWIKLETIGKQGHASNPDECVNAHRIGMEVALDFYRYVRKKYSDEDPLFTPSRTTFEPTRKEENVGNVNTIPGKDVLYFDGRILPKYDLDDFIYDLEKLAMKHEVEKKVKIKLDVIQRFDAPPPTPTDSDVVERLKDTIEKLRGIKVKIGGIGGGTCAAHFRRLGIPAVVWSTIDGTAHNANEYARIENLVNDAKVYAMMAIS
ncbi:MAG: diaminopimelate aminotransferase [Thermotoga sp.]|nr:MAG: diaminopimelate aminotransferase [Thermotoga sp.]